MNSLEKIFSNDFKSFCKDYFEYIDHLLQSIDLEQLSKIVDEIESARSRESTIFVVGNGGSASTASHIYTDWALGTKCFESPFKILSLTDNSSLMTAISNDFGYEFLFEKQLRVHARQNDVLLCISASGNSPNLIAASEVASSLDMVTLGFLGFDGGKLASKLDMSVLVSTPLGEYGPVEDVHMIFNHVIANFFLNKFKNER